MRKVSKTPTPPAMGRDLSERARPSLRRDVGFCCRLSPGDGLVNIYSTMREPILHVRHDVGDGGPEGEAAVQGVGVQHGEGVTMRMMVPKVSFVVVKKAAWRRGKRSLRSRWNLLFPLDIHGE